MQTTLQKLLEALLFDSEDLKLKPLENELGNVISNEEGDALKTNPSVSPDKDLDINNEEATYEELLAIAKLESLVELRNKNNLSERLAESQTMDREKKCSALSWLETLKEAINILRDPLVKEEKHLLYMASFLKWMHQVLDVTVSPKVTVKERKDACTLDQPLQVRLFPSDRVFDFFLPDEMATDLADQQKSLVFLHYDSELLFESVFNKAQANFDLVFSSVGILSGLLKEDKFQDFTKESSFLIQLLKEVCDTSSQTVGADLLALLELSKEPRTILSEPPWIQGEKLLWSQLQKETEMVTDLLASLELNVKTFSVGKASDLIRSHLNSLKTVLHQTWQTIEMYKVSLFNTLPWELHSTNYKKLISNSGQPSDAEGGYRTRYGDNLHHHLIDTQTEETVKLETVFQDLDSIPAIDKNQTLIAALDKHHMQIDKLLDFISTYSSRRSQILLYINGSISSATELTENKVGEFGTVPRFTVMNSRMRSPARSTSELYQLAFSERALNKLRREYSDDQKVKSWLDKATSLAASDGEQYYSIPHPIPILYDMTCCAASPNDSSCEGVQALVEFVTSGSDNVTSKAQSLLNDRRRKRKSLRLRSFPAHRVRFGYTNWILVTDTESHELGTGPSSGHSKESSDADESDSRDYSKFPPQGVPNTNVDLTNTSHDDGHQSKKRKLKPKHVRRFQRALAEANRVKSISSDTEDEDFMVVLHIVSDYPESQ